MYRFTLTLLLYSAISIHAKDQVAFDIETTGFSSRKDRIIEIAAVRFDGDKVIENKCWLINPERSIPPSATAVHGITDKDLAKAESIRSVLPAFLAFAKDASLIAHNARFDWGFIKAEAQRNDIPLPEIKLIDTLPLSRAWWPDARNHKLQTLAKALEIEVDVKHRALADAELLRRVYLRGMSQRASAEGQTSADHSAPELQDTNR